jgi:hypothetical protein
MRRSTSRARRRCRAQRAEGSHPRVDRAWLAIIGARNDVPPLDLLDRAGTWGAPVSSTNPPPQRET